MTRTQPAKLKALTPGELAQNYVRWAQSVKDAPGITWGIPAIDKVMIPMHPGDLVGIVARPGHCKTTLLAYLARREARRIMANEKRNPPKKGDVREVVVFCTWESSAEEIENFWISDSQFSSSDVAWGRVPMDVIQRKMAKRANFPVYTIGYSIAGAGTLQPRMYLPNVLEAIEGINDVQPDYQVKVTLMLFDYLQLMPVEGVYDKHAAVLQAPSAIKNVALRVGAPAVCAVQAKREVDDRRDKIPEPGDCQWSSAIEQHSDKLFGAWRPCKTEEKILPNGELNRIDHGGRCGENGYPITDTLFFLRMTKQRWEQARHTWPLHLAPQWLKLAAMETEFGTQSQPPVNF